MNVNGDPFSAIGAILKARVLSLDVDSDLRRKVLGYLYAYHPEIHPDQCAEITFARLTQLILEDGGIKPTPMIEELARLEELTDAERDIFDALGELQAAGDATIRSHHIAAKAGHGEDGTRHHLSQLMKRGYIEHDRRHGYRVKYVK